jgi:RNA 3'-terminal phosphate cyclase (ATP)
MAMTDVLTIDGSFGEGGGQIIRSAMTLAALHKRGVVIENIRARRSNPGLAAQHLTAIRATAALCGARLAGDELGSRSLTFLPGGPSRAGDYDFDVGAARPGGSAGSASLVLQTVLLPLAFADGLSRITIIGGTHMPWSPPCDYLEHAWLPALAAIGIDATIVLEAWGFFPIGQGRISARVSGRGERARSMLRPLDLTARGPLRRIFGRAVAANLPAHIAQRMVAHADSLLSGLGVPVQISAEPVAAACRGAGIFLTAEYERCRCGFSALGQRGKPAEQVAEEAVEALTTHFRSEAAVDRHLADQLLLPLSLAPGVSGLSTERVTGHLRTNAWVIERFGVARITIDERADGSGVVAVEPATA